MKEGIVLINKPDGITSHDVVAKVRRIFNMRRIGHAGTLDPLATGVLVILIGAATKLFNKFVTFDKAYRATLILGTATTSADTQGEIIERLPYEHVTREQVQEAFKGFVGASLQVPPMVSAVKVRGRKLYQLARQGIIIDRQPREIRIDHLRMEEFNPPEVQFSLECSKGTYVRQLAEDIGKLLACGACISQIQRTRVGGFRLEDAVTIEELNESHIRNWEG